MFQANETTWVRKGDVSFIVAVGLTSTAIYMSNGQMVTATMAAADVLAALAQA